MYYVQYTEDDELLSISQTRPLWGVAFESEFVYFFVDGIDLIAVDARDYCIPFANCAYLFDQLNLKTGPIVPY